MGIRAVAALAVLSACAHPFAGSVWEDQQDTNADVREYLRFDANGILESANERGGRWTGDGTAHWSLHGDRLVVIRTGGDDMQLRVDGDRIRYLDGKDPNVYWARRVKVRWGALPQGAATYCYTVTCEDGLAMPMCYATDGECEAARAEAPGDCFFERYVSSSPACSSSRP